MSKTRSLLFAMAHHDSRCPAARSVVQLLVPFYLLPSTDSPESAIANILASHYSLWYRVCQAKCGCDGGPLPSLFACQLVVRLMDRRRVAKEHTKASQADWIPGRRPALGGPA